MHGAYLIKFKGESGAIVLVSGVGLPERCRKRIWHSQKNLSLEWYDATKNLKSENYQSPIFYLGAGVWPPPKNQGGSGRRPHACE